MKILGINISHHASSCLLIDNEIKFLLEDERINRKKGYIPEDDLDDLENGSFKINFAEKLLNYTSHLDYVIFSSFGRTNNFDNFIIERYKEGMKKSGINKESDIVADIQIGPTNKGMVRIFVSSDKIEIPMDFSPEEAINIAEELKVSAETAKKNN